jgi:hypothetical protein
MSTFFDLRERMTSWFFRRDRDIHTGGKDINTGGGNVIVGAGSVDGVDLTAHVADVDAHHNRSHALDSGSDHTGTLPWADLNKTGSDLADLATRAHSDLTGVTSDQHHNESHTVASHSDTTATGSELNDLTDGSDAGSLHIHDGRYFRENEFSSSPTGSEPVQAGGSGGVNFDRLGVGVSPTAADDAFIAEYVRTGEGAVFGSTSSSLHPGQGKILIAEAAAPGTPGSGFGVIYVKTDGILYFKNDSGTETALT